uniref:MMPL family transporter n=1 Tax=Gordonia paraffinivorans TaxID=175628 RepID=UPI00242D3EA5
MALYLYRLGKAAYLNPLKVIAAWLVVLGGLIGAGLAFSEPTADNFKVPGMPSEYAGKILEKNFGGAGADPFTESNATIVFRANDGTLRDPQNVRAMDTVLAEIAKIDHVVDPELVTNPVTAPMPDPATLPPRLRQQVEAQAQQQEIIAATKSTEQRQADEAVLSQVSGDARVARVDVEFGRKIYDLPKNTPDKIRAAAQKGRDLGIQVETEGSAAVGEKPPGGESEAIGVAVAALVLIITFGSLVAWGLPLINALIAVPVALFGIETATGFWRIGTFPEVLTIMIGLAVSIDYVLFIVSRYRHELTRRPTRERADRAEAAGIAVGTGGSAVIFAGLTVIVALAALAFIGVPFLGEMGVAAAWGVAVAVAVAVSFLPAVLGLFGTRVFAGRVKGLHPPDTPEGDAHTSLGSRWGTLVRRAPIVVCLAGVAILGVIAIPATDMKTALPGSSTSEKSTTERKAYDLIAQAWGPGAASP